MNHSTIARALTRVIRMSIAAALLAGLFAVTQPARAEIYMVTNTLNSGSGSLRDAITKANSTPGDDTITFHAAIDTMPIVLAGLDGEDGNISGDLDIKDGGDLTIQGNGTANTIIEGGGVDRVFHICPGYGCTNTVTLSGMTIKNGNANGGGIFNEGGTLRVVGSTIRDNTGNYGGGIYNQLTGTATVNGSTIRDNTAIYGGGIFNKAILTVLNDSTIGGTGTGNTATDGGGIYNQLNATTTVDGSTVSANTATNNGGGIYNNTSGNATVNASTVSTNSAHYGGGIYNDGTLTVRNGSTIGGAGAGNQGIDNHPSGGGIYNDAGGTTTVDSSTISANTAYNGGGVDNRGVLTVTNSTIGGASAGNQSAEFGGGISNGAGSMATVDGSTVSANTARIGGGVDNGGTLTVTDSIIGGAGEGNEAEDGGGGIYNGVGGMATVDGSTVSVNTAKNGAGIDNRGSLIVTNSTIGGAGAANQATIWGGGIYNYAGTMMVTGSCILNNWATINGGGLFNDENSFGATIVTGSSIVGNNATSFFNNQAAEQIATGNWWGAATGPNKPGADTVDGNVDTAGYLTEPISDCLTNIYLPLVLK